MLGTVKLWATHDPATRTSMDESGMVFVNTRTKSKQVAEDRAINCYVLYTSASHYAMHIILSLDTALLLDEDQRDMKICGVVQWRCYFPSQSWYMHVAIQIKHDKTTVAAQRRLRGSFGVSVTKFGVILHSHSIKTYSWVNTIDSSCSVSIPNHSRGCFLVTTSISGT